MKLMIVESPAKIKKIKQFLGDGWIVKGSAGHIRDLPENEIGFELPDFLPHYVPMKGKKKTIDDLKELSFKADEVYLATDLDREGEAIAFHLEEALNLKNPKRITFNEITQKAIDNSLKNVRQINYDLVRAYEARRILDRIIGYYISPELSDKAKISLSAGRVQSVCLKIVVHREREIEKFTPEAYYDLEIELENGIRAALQEKDWTDQDHIYDKEIINILSDIKKIKAIDIKTEEKNDFPRSPFISSTLQQSAHKVFGFSPSKTMECAQTLHEAGVITYHRTDSPNLSSDGFEMIRAWLENNKLPYIDTPKKYSSKSSAQEAHEAIRPSDITLVNPDVDKESQMLYELIRERTLASAMPPAIDKITTCTFESDEVYKIGSRNAKAKFYAKANITIDNTWRDFVKLEPKNTKELMLDTMPKVGEGYACEAFIKEKKTKAPRRFNEADLIKALERLGIGRPSTYASILENIKSRKYIKVGKGDKLITPLPVGCAVVDALQEMSFMNLQYTNIVEEELDKIANGQTDFKTLLTAVHKTIQQEMERIKIPILITTENCPKCSNPMKKIKKRGKDPFWVHLNENDNCDKFISDMEGKPVIKAPFLEKKCPGCGKIIKRLKSKKNDSFFWVHIEEEHSKECMKFLSDKEGEPLLKN